MAYARYAGPRRGDAAYAGRMLVAQDWKDSEPGYFDFIF